MLLSRGTELQTGWLPSLAVPDFHDMQFHTLPASRQNY